MSDGFLGYKTSFMLDVVICALFLVVPLLLYSLYQVKFARNYVRHRNLQVALGIILLLAVGAFEVDMQLVHGGWENIVRKQELDEPALTERIDQARSVLYLHLVFAISTPILWGVTLTLALRRFPSPPQPAGHSRTHRVLGWLSTLDITATSVTGVWFYYVAFVRAI